MYWPLERPAVARADVPFGNRIFLESHKARVDASMTWGTDVDVSALEDYAREATRQQAVLISPLHIMLKAIGVSLDRHPNFNCRVVGRRIYRFRDINLLLAIQDLHRGEADLMLLRELNAISLRSLALAVWREVNKTARGNHRVSRDKRRLYRLGRFFGWVIRRFNWCCDHLPLPLFRSSLGPLGAAVVVSPLNFPGAPPLRSVEFVKWGNLYSTHIVIGPTEPRPVVENGRVVVRPVVPLFVRADHRLVDGVDLGRFVATLREYLRDPQSIPELKNQSAESESTSAFVR